MIKEFQNSLPQLGQKVYISENATVIGNVILGDEVNIWFGSVLRGDMHYIKIGNRSNVQDNAVVHVTTAVSPTNIGSGVTVGHGAIIHGCTIGDDCMIGMGAIIMDDAVIGSGSLVGAGALVPPNMKVPPKSLVVGMPGKVIREIKNEEHKMILDRPQEYIELAAIYLKGIS
jgi:carbonic anhydrase/acetyltransferase-like protein (isoleucine patch superfamily)